MVTAVTPSHLSIMLARVTLLEWTGEVGKCGREEAKTGESRCARLGGVAENRSRHQRAKMAKVPSISNENDQIHL